MHDRNGGIHVTFPAISGKVKHLVVEIQCTGPYYSGNAFTVGQIDLYPRMQWNDLTSALADCVEGYFRQVDGGLRTKKVLRLDPEPSADEGQYTLGLSSSSVIGYQLGKAVNIVESSNFHLISSKLIFGFCHSSCPIVTTQLL